jgi:hypothetical protein
MFLKLGINKKQREEQALPYIILNLKKSHYVDKDILKEIEILKSFLSPEGNSFDNPYSWLWTS